MPPHCNRTVSTQPLQQPPHGDADISRIIEMAWEDRTAFEAIAVQFGLNESGVVALMRRHLRPSSFRMWRKRMAGRTTKHAALRGAQFLRHCATHTRQ
nr:TIGR03643 family protein [uncultured Rhodoferax sp.]